MADRSVVVRLRADITQYQAALARAKSETASFGRDITDLGNKNRAVFDNIGKGALLGGAVVAAGFGLAVGAAMKFDTAMSEVAAVAGATSGELDQLRQAAIDAGAATVFSASEAAKAQAELVKAGISVQDVLGGGLTGVLDLAAAGTLDLAQAATIAAQAMNIFDLSGSDVGHIADLLAAGANKSAADVGQLGDALRQGGLVAAQYGVSIEETVGTLAAFADNALIGSDAGTSLKTMLQRLSPISKESAELMAKVGFSAYDSAGNFIGLAGVAEELKSSLAGMTQQQRDTTLAQLFGSDAVRGANVLYEQGAAGLKDYTEAVDDQGAAAEMAAKKLDNLGGDLEQLKGSIETALIQGGSKATGALRGMTQAATDVVNGFSSMPGAMQNVVLGASGIAGAAALAVGGFITLAPKIDAAKKALEGMDSSIGKAIGGNMGKLAGGAAALGAAVVIGAYAYDKATASAREYDATVKELAGSLAPVLEGQTSLNTALKDFFELKSKDFSDEEVSAMSALGVTLTDVRQAIIQGKDALDPFREAVRATGVDMQGVDFGRLGQKGSLSEPLNDLARYLDVDRQALIDLSDEIEDWDGHAQDAAKRSIEMAKNQGELTQAQVDAAYEQSQLEDGTTNYAAALNRLAPESEIAAEGAKAVTAEMKSEAEQAAATEAAIKALEEANKALGDSYGKWTSGSEAYQAVIDKSKEWATATAEATESADDSWETFFDGHTVSLKAYLEELDRQVDAQAEWKENLARIALVAGAEVAEAMASSALPEEVALLASASDEELRRGAQAWMQTATDGGADMGEALRTQLDVMAAIGRLGAEATAREIATQLGIGLDEVKWIAAAYGIAIAEGLDPALQKWLRLNELGMGASADALQAEKFINRATGGIVPAYLTAGGFPGGPRGTDTIPAWLSPGEYVMQKSAVDRFGVSYMDSVNAGITPATGAWGGGSMDNSRHTTINAPITVAERRVAKDVVHNLTKIQIQAAAP